MGEITLLLSHCLLYAGVFLTPCHNMSFEQKTNIKLLVKLGKTATETLSMLNGVYGDEIMSLAQVFEWHKQKVCQWTR